MTRPTVTRKKRKLYDVTLKLSVAKDSLYADEDALASEIQGWMEDLNEIVESITIQERKPKK